MVSLRTRKVRLPVPSMAQLDQARVIGSSFEQQRWGDIFRIPFCRMKEYAPELPADSSGDSEDGHKSAKKRATDKEGLLGKTMDEKFLPLAWFGLVFWMLEMLFNFITTAPSECRVAVAMRCLRLKCWHRLGLAIDGQLCIEVWYQAAPDRFYPSDIKTFF
jgi:hypothetical protein